MKNEQQRLLFHYLSLPTAYPINVKRVQLDDWCMPVRMHESQFWNSIH